MRRRGASLVVIVALALAGCRGGADKRAADDKYTGPTPAGETTGRAANPDTPAHWLDRPKPDWMKGSTPAAPSWTDPKSPGYDLKAEAGGLLAGYVEDPEGRKVRGVYIAVRESSDKSPTPVGVVSDPSGTFIINGLKPNRNYQLTVDATIDGRKLMQTVYVRTPNPNVRLSLLEADGGASAPAPVPVKTPDPPANNDPLTRPPTGNIPNPDGPLPVPKIGTGDRDPGVAPVGGYEPPLNPDALPKGERFDLMTDQGPVPWKPPVANMPVPRLGTTVPSATPPARGESRKQAFAFVDHTGKETHLPAGKLVLVVFHTAGSMACVRAVPVLNDLHDKYAARGLAVASVGCEDEPVSARVMAADLFRKDHGVKYTIVTESAKKAGEALKRFGVTDLPAAVLLNDQGEVLWQGNPGKPTGLAEAIEAGVK